MNDARSHQVVFVANCLLNPNVKVPGTAQHAGALPDLMRLLVEQGLGVVQMPCPEAEHLGLGRPLGTDSLEQYDKPAYRQACAALAWDVCKRIENLNAAGVRVMAILGVEGSPSCSVIEVPVLRDGRRVMSPGTGLFVRALEQALGKANLSVPILGIPESGQADELARALGQLDGLLDPRPEAAFDEGASRLGMHPLAGQGAAAPSRSSAPPPRPSIPTQVAERPESRPAPNAPRSAQAPAEVEQQARGLSLSDGLLRVKQADGPALELRLDELRTVAIETFGLASDGPGPLWVLESRSGKKIAFSMGLEGEDAFLAAAQSLPGFDDGALIDAVSAVEEGRFICWREA